jgi:RimJ/RimL family protein N-acetyltransferase
VGVATCPRKIGTSSPQEKPASVFTIQLRTTPRIILTPFCKKDVADLFQLYSNPETMQYMGGAVKHLPEVDLILGQYQRHWKLHGIGPMAIREARTGKVIGRTGLRISESVEVVDLDLTDGCVVPLKLDAKTQIGWVIHPQHRKKGIVTEAANAVLEYAFKVRKVNEVAAFIRIDNYASVKVARKLGMSLVGSFLLNGYLWEYHSLTLDNFFTYGK